MLHLRQWFVREHVGLMKLTDTYDIFDPATNTQVGIAKEEPGTLMTVLRLIIHKRMLPTKVCVYEGAQPDGQPLFSIHRGFTLFRSKVLVRGEDQSILGWFQSKLISLGGAFKIFRADGQEVAAVKGDWKGWNFTITTTAGQQLGQVTKKWGGLGKELFTSADNYMISVSGEPDETNAILLLAAGLAVDTVYKEH